MSVSSGSVKRQELARFLRARRETLSPEDVGLPRQRRRRTPGLRREEVALLAGIGAAWYSRLEMAHDVKASVPTLLAIGRALRLSTVEQEYLFTVADVPMPKLEEPDATDVPEAVEQLIPAVRQLGIFLWGRYLTPLRWNAIADALFAFSDHADPVERNTVIRMVCNGERAELFGDFTDELHRGMVGMFRRAYQTHEPTPHGRRVYEAAMKYPHFKDLWERHVIAEDYFAEPGPHQRFHDVVGKVVITTTNFYIARHQGMVLRIIAPADEATAEKFVRLQELGTPSTRETQIPE